MTLYIPGSVVASPSSKWLKVCCHAEFTARKLKKGGAGGDGDGGDNGLCGCQVLRVSVVRCFGGDSGGEVMMVTKGDASGSGGDGEGSGANGNNGSS